MVASSAVMEFEASLKTSSTGPEKDECSKQNSHKKLRIIIMTRFQKSFAWTHHLMKLAAVFVCDCLLYCHILGNSRLFFSNRILQPTLPGTSCTNCPSF